MISVKKQLETDIVGGNQNILDVYNRNYFEPLFWAPFKNNLNVIRGGGVFTYERASTGTYLDPVTGYIKTAAIDTPRFERTGLLLEGESTNRLLYSNDFTNAVWTKSNSSVLTDGTLSPDGSSLAYKFIESVDATSTITHSIQQSLSWTANRTETLSLFVKPGTNGRHIYIGFPAAAWGDATVRRIAVNIKTGSVVWYGGSGISSKITKYNNNWLKLEITATPSVTTTGSILYVLTKNDTLDTTYQGDGVSYIYIAFAQQESSKLSTSYIPTTSAAVPRYADKLYIPAKENILAQMNDQTIVFDVDSNTKNGNIIQTMLAVDSETSRKFRLNNYDSTTFGNRPEYTFGSNTYVGNKNTDFTKPTRIVIRNIVKNNYGEITIFENKNIVYQTEFGKSYSTLSSIIGNNLIFGAEDINGLNSLFGHISNVRIYDKAFTNEEIFLL